MGCTVEYKDGKVQSISYTNPVIWNLIEDMDREAQSKAPNSTDTLIRSMLMFVGEHAKDDADLSEVLGTLYQFDKLLETAKFHVLERYNDDKLFIKSVLESFEDEDRIREERMKRYGKESDNGGGDHRPDGTAADEGKRANETIPEESSGENHEIKD